MDLRDKKLTNPQIEEVEQLILYNNLSYQPFIFTNDLETGVGQRVQDGFEKYDGENKGGSIYWKDAPQEATQRLKTTLVSDLNHFRRCNAEYRRMYDHFIDSIVDQLGGEIADLTFAELGCNSGYFMHSLALRGARRCVGLDVGPFEEVFKWFNKTLGIKNEFQHAEWDPSTHSVNGSKIPEVDVFLSIAVSCHVPDPIQHLAYLCDYSKKAVFFWVPINKNEGFNVSFTKPGKVYKRFSWPFSFDTNVKLSSPLVKLILKESGFEDIREINCPNNLSPIWQKIYSENIGFLAFRKSDIRSALYKRDNNIPDHERLKAYLKKANYRNYNIVYYDGKYYGFPQKQGKFNINLVGTSGYVYFSGNTIDEVEKHIDQFTGHSIE